jgi:hypothetical protein
MIISKKPKSRSRVASTASHESFLDTGYRIPVIKMTDDGVWGKKNAKNSEIEKWQSGGIGRWVTILLFFDFAI